MIQRFLKEKFALLIMVSFFSFNIYSQNTEPIVAKDLPALSYGVGVSINDYSFGVMLEKPISHKLSVFGNAGYGGWQFKLGGGVMYYPLSTPYGSSFSVGFCRASGGDDIEFNLKVEPDDQFKDVRLHLHPVNTFNLIYHYSIKNKNNTRVVFSGGYAFVLGSSNYEILSDHELTKTSKEVMQILEPGGIILGARLIW